MKKAIIILLHLAMLSNAQDIELKNLVSSNNLTFTKKKELFTGNAYTLHSNGSVQRIIPFYNGKINGVVTEFREDESIFSIATFKDGFKEGEFISKYPNGEKSQLAFYKNDLKHGEFITWYEDGSIQSIAYYRDDLLNGEASTWYSNGVKSSLVYYVNNKKSGNYTEWHENGSLAAQWAYLDGEIISPKRVYNRNGVEIINK